MNNYSLGRNLGKMLSESLSEDRLPGFLVLQELLSAVAFAEKLVAEITARFDRGDPASGLCDRLNEWVGEIGRGVSATRGRLPDAVSAAIAQLLTHVQMAVARGDAWLTRPEVNLQITRHRLQRAYGLIPRAP